MAIRIIVLYPLKIKSAKFNSRQPDSSRNTDLLPCAYARYTQVGNSQKRQLVEALVQKGKQ